MAHLGSNMIAFTVMLFTFSAISAVFVFTSFSERYLVRVVVALLVWSSLLFVLSALNLLVLPADADTEEMIRPVFYASGLVLTAVGLLALARKVVGTR